MKESLPGKVCLEKAPQELVCSTRSALVAEEYEAAGSSDCLQRSNKGLWRRMVEAGVHQRCGSLRESMDNSPLVHPRTQSVPRPTNERRHPHYIGGQHDIIGPVQGWYIALSVQPVQRSCSETLCRVGGGESVGVPVSAG